MQRSTLLDRGAAELGRGELAQAAGTYREILADDPEDAEALSNLGAVMNAAQAHGAAEQACRKALTIRPGHWAALANLGAALHHQNRRDEAVPAYAAAIGANPGNVSAWTNLGVALNEQWRLPEALTAHGAAVKLAPDDPQIRMNRAMALLMAGDFRQGFAEFEWRWRCSSMAPHGITQPQWTGANPSGRTILVHEEGGFGDTLQFCRYVPLLTARGARVVLRVQAPLARLLRDSMPDSVTVISPGDALPPFDLHCPMLSLPHAFGTTLETVPAALPYLTPCPNQALRWRSRLAAARGGHALTVGLCWSGSKTLGSAEGRAMDARRSLTLEALAPLALPRLRLVSLQFGGSEEAADPPLGMVLHDPMKEMADFADTAALVAGLDLVISVDTSVCHLAGALGRPVWVLSRHDSCWRWIANRQDSPWYPTLRLFRQPQAGAWAPVIDEVAAELRAIAQSRMAAPPQAAEVRPSSPAPS